MVNESIIHQDVLMLMLFLLLLLNPQSPGFLDELTFSDVASVVTLTTTITAFRRQKNLRKSVVTPALWSGDGGTDRDSNIGCMFARTTVSGGLWE